jgi:benzoyl-CoA reductase subunit C
MRNRAVELQRLKEGEGKKIVAHLVGDYVPTEMIHAAGAVPLGLVHGGDPEAVEAAHRAILRYLCPFSRAQFGYWVLGEQRYYTMFDLLVAPITCQHLRRTADLYNVHTTIPIFRLGVPQPYDGERGVTYYTEGLGLLKQRLEQLTGNEITDAKLRDHCALSPDKRVA